MPGRSCSTYVRGLFEYLTSLSGFNDSVTEVVEKDYAGVNPDEGMMADLIEHVATGAMGRALVSGIWELMPGLAHPRGLSGCDFLASYEVTSLLNLDACADGDHTSLRFFCPKACGCDSSFGMDECPVACVLTECLEANASCVTCTLGTATSASLGITTMAGVLRVSAAPAARRGGGGRPTARTAPTAFTTLGIWTTACRAWVEPSGGDAPSPALTVPRAMSTPATATSAALAWDAPRPAGGLSSAQSARLGGTTRGAWRTIASCASAFGRRGGARPLQASVRLATITTAPPTIAFSVAETVRQGAAVPRLAPPAMLVTPTLTGTTRVSLLGVHITLLETALRTDARAMLDLSV